MIYSIWYVIDRDSASHVFWNPRCLGGLAVFVMAGLVFLEGTHYERIEGNLVSRLSGLEKEEGSLLLTIF